MKFLPTIAVSFLFAVAAQAATPSFEYFSYTGKDLFPSAIISTATVDWNEFDEEDEEKEAPEVPILGDTNGWIGVALHDVPKGAKLTVELSGDGWLKTSKFSGKAVDTEGAALEGDIDVMPKGVWDYEALRKVREQKPVNLTIKVTVNGKALPEQNETLIIRSMNDCPFFVKNDPDDEENVDDLSWCFAAYVNENHPWIDALLKEALNTAKNAEGGPLINNFIGYQGKSEESVLEQVFAIWQVLQRRGIKYSDVSTTVPSKTVISQVVRFVDETVEATQANCVDGSVLMASILTKIGLHAHLVLVPGHCFLAFNTDPNDEDSLVGLETTMLGRDRLKSAEELKILEEKAADKQLDLKKLNGFVAKEAKASLNTFANAVATGNANLKEHKEAFDEGTDPNTQIISIGDWRKRGIMPLASGKERR